MGARRFAIIVDAVELGKYIQILLVMFILSF